MCLRCGSSLPWESSPDPRATILMYPHAIRTSITPHHSTRVVRAAGQLFQNFPRNLHTRFDFTSSDQLDARLAGPSKSKRLHDSSTALMDALLTSLHALSLLPPSPSQLLQLLSGASNPEEEDKDVRDLARVLSLGSFNRDAQDDEEEEEAEGSAGFGIVDRELIEDAVVEMIRAFKKDVAKCRNAYEGEYGPDAAAPASLPKTTPLRFLKLRHDSASRQAEKVASLYGGYRPRVIFSGGPSYSCTKELSELRAATEPQSLQVGGRLTDRYIIGRVASSVSVYVGASFLLTLPEPFGFSIPVAVSHFVRSPSTTTEEASRLLPEGTLLAIKEPYISPHHALRASGTSGGVGIRVDTPTDLVVIPHVKAQWAQRYVCDLKWAVEPEPPAKGKGKKAGKPDAAAQAQASAPTAPSPATPTWLAEQTTTASSSDALRNVQALLDAGRPGAAWRAFTAVQASANDQQALELKGDIFLALQEWNAAAEAFANASSASRADAARELARQSRDGPHASGSTVSHVYHAHLSSPTPRVRVADWLSSALKVAKIPNAGRGLVTTREVAAGETLLMAKSRGSSYPSDAGLTNCPILRCDFANGVLSTTTQVLATTNLIHEMIDRPEITQEILGLTAGPATPDSPWVKAEEFEKAKVPADIGGWVAADRIGPTGGINALYVDEVLRHNAFGPGIVSRGDGDDGEISSSSKINDGNAAAASTSSSSPLPSRWPRALQRKLVRDPPSAFTRSTQPHPLPAILNHACLPNVSSIFLGDVVLTKALRPLRKGEEISHEYVRGGMDYAARQSLLSKHGFVCRCPLCDLDRSDGDERLQARKRIFAVQVPAVYGRSDALLSRSGRGAVCDERDRESHRDIREALQDVVCDLQKTYNDDTRGNLRPEMREILERVGRHAVLEGQTDLGIRHLLQSLLSVNAKLSPEWDTAARKGADIIEALSTATAAMSLSAPSPHAIVEAPAIHVDEAQRTIWRIAQILLCSATPSRPELSLVWSRTASHVHEILIGGGLHVLKDRWGPTNAKEEATLEWLDAWNLWERESGHCM